jgi:hypothetical protein
MTGDKFTGNIADSWDGLETLCQVVASCQRHPSTEDALFYGLDSTSYARANAPGYPDDQLVPNPNDSVARVNGNGPKVAHCISF